MGFAFYFFVSWLFVTLFSVMKKNLSFVENTFIYLLLLVISINWSWIIYEELKLVKLSTDPLNYTAFLINRSIAVPLIIVIAFNLLKRVNTSGHLLLIIGGSVFILTTLTIIGRYLHITKLENWSTIYDVLYFIGLHLIGFVSLKFLQNRQTREVEGS